MSMRMWISKASKGAFTVDPLMVGARGLSTFPRMLYSELGDREHGHAVRVNRGVQEEELDDELEWRLEEPEKEDLMRREDFLRKGMHCRTISMSHKLGKELLKDPYLNKGTAFPECERERLHIRGLVPPAYTGLLQQGQRLLTLLAKEQDATRQWAFLTALQDRNETLYYHLLSEHVELLAPIIYTPTVAYACLNYSSIFRQPRGMFFTAKDRGQMAAMVHNWPVREVEVVVVTDGSRVLGLGDLGLHGIGVVAGKVDLYVAGGGFYPSRTLPCVLDVGTNNVALRQDPLYLGTRAPRLAGREYLDVVDEFMAAVRLRWPRAVIQFEDFQTKHAEMLLERYRHSFRVFNDDIQGTAGIAVAAVYGALAVKGLPPKAIVHEKFVICGAGSAGMGVASALMKAMVKHGLSTQEALENFWVLDHHGLITSARLKEGHPTPGRNRSTDTSVQKFMRKCKVEAGGGSSSDSDKDEEENGRPPLLPEGSSLEDVIRAVKPSAIVGLTGVGGLWSGKVLEAMGEGCARPMIFPMSNPTDNAECTADQAAEHTQNRAIFASGSPFEDVKSEDGQVLMKSNQSNNFYIFPGVGLGAQVAQIGSISDEQFLVAAEALSGMTPPDEQKKGVIFPRLKDIRKISNKIAVEVIKQAMKEGQEVSRVIEKLYPLLKTDEQKLDRTLLRILDDPNQSYHAQYSSIVYRAPGIEE